MNYLASIRGRLGWAINDWLLYGTVGWGFSRFEFTENMPAAAFSGKLRLEDEGIVYGGGVEWMLAYGVSLRAEYLRYDLGHSTSIPISFPTPMPATASASTTSTWRARPSTSSSATSKPGHTAERHSAMPFGRVHAAATAFAASRIAVAANSRAARKASAIAGA